MNTSYDLWINQARRLQTEEEWRSWEFLNPLIKLIDPSRYGDRKPRLFTAACVRRLWDSPHLGKHGWVAEALERQADTPPTTTEVQSVASALREVRLSCTDVMGGMYWQMSIDYPTEPETDLWRVAWATAEAAIIAAGRQTRITAGLPDDRPDHVHSAAEESTLCDLLRCIFGNPFRSVTVDPSRIGWCSGTVRRLAQSVSEDGSFDLLPILSDALEEAGCTETGMLEHCRSTALHARGCWAVDLLLGRN